MKSATASVLPTQTNPHRLLFFPVISTTLMEIGILPNAAVLLLVSRVLFLVINLSYYFHLGRKPKKM